VQHLRGAVALARVPHLSRTLLADDAGEIRLREAADRTADVRAVLAELGVLGGDREITVIGDVIAHADTVAVDARDDGLQAGADRLMDVLEELQLLRALVPTLLDVAAGAERSLARAREHHDTDAAIEMAVQHGPDDGGHGLVTPGIQDLLTIDGDAPHPGLHVLLVDDDVGQLVAAVGQQRHAELREIVGSRHGIPPLCDYAGSMTPAP